MGEGPASLLPPELLELTRPTDGPRSVTTHPVLGDETRWQGLERNALGEVTGGVIELAALPDADPSTPKIDLSPDIQRSATEFIQLALRTARSGEQAVFALTGTPYQSDQTRNQREVARTIAEWVARQPERRDVRAGTEYQWAPYGVDGVVIFEFTPGRYEVLSISLVGPDGQGRWKIGDCRIQSGIDATAANAVITRFQTDRGSFMEVGEESVAGHGGGRTAGDSSGLYQDLQTLEQVSIAARETSVNRPPLSSLGIRRMIAEQMGINLDAVGHFAASYRQLSDGRTALDVRVLRPDPRDPALASVETRMFTQNAQRAWEQERQSHVRDKLRRVKEEVAFSGDPNIPLRIAEDTLARSTYQAFQSGAIKTTDRLVTHCRQYPPQSIGLTTAKDGSRFLWTTGHHYPADTPQDRRVLGLTIQLLELGGKLTYLAHFSDTEAQLGRQGSIYRPIAEQAFARACTVSLTRDPAKETPAKFRTLGQVAFTPYGKVLDALLTWLALGRMDEAAKFLARPDQDTAWLNNLTPDGTTTYDSVGGMTRESTDPQDWTVQRESGPQSLQLIFKGGRWLIQPPPQPAAR